jgi:hypothetical protein
MHWLRSSVDTFLWQSAKANGAHSLEEVELAGAVYDQVDNTWELRIADVTSPNSPLQTVRASWVIDASGGGNALARFVDNPQDDHWMLTRNRAIFGHYTDVLPFSSGLVGCRPVLW